MRVIRLLLFLSCLLEWPTLGSAQAPGKSSVRDPSALSIVSKALTASGYQPLANAISSLQVSGTTKPLWELDEPSGTFVHKVKISGDKVESRNEFQSKDQRSVFATGHGAPFVSSDHSSRKIFGHLAVAASPTEVPILVLGYALANRKYSITIPAVTKTDVPTLLHVRISDDTDIVTSAVTPQDWYFDASSGLPLRVEYRVPETQNAIQWRIAARDFADFKWVNGVLIPLQYTDSIDGKLVSTSTINAIQFNDPISDSTFDDSTTGAN